MKKLSIIFLLAWFAALNVHAQDQPAVTERPPAAVAIKPYSAVITANTISKPGLFTIHKNDDKYFFEIPDSILARELLVTGWIVKVPGGSPVYGGELVNQQVISFENGTPGKIFMKLITTIQAADSTTMISTAVRNSNMDPIAMVFDIRARGKDNTSSVIEVTDFFQKENSFSAAPGGLKKALGLTNLIADRSSIKNMNAYPINIEVKTVRTYAATGAPVQVAGRPAQPALEAAKEGAAVTIELSVSIMLMPKTPMATRKFDYRVGYFASGYKVFSDNQQRVHDNLFIVRYRLEPKAGDMEKYKRGELVEPKEQIVYYVDPATPKQWRPYVIAGINDWNIAFEKAGFKNAIVGKEWPENDTTMSLEDARYKVVRYLPSETANAYGPNIHDPRSGEILQSYVGWYHNIMKLLHDWYFVQASPIDPEARKMTFSTELMGKLIQFAVAHEIGHTLGLRHNMGSSSLTPVEKLRDKKWVEANGHTVSIMDYARFNYVAQPEDNISEAGIMPRIGVYDKWAIQWGYRYTGVSKEEDDKISSKWVLDSLKANPKLWFGGEGRNYDARCQTEDIGDNSTRASEYGIKNLKYVMAHLREWTKEDNDTYKNLLDMYRQVASQFQRYSLHVTMNVASVFEQIKTVEQPGDVYIPAKKEIQKEAVAFLNREVFQTPTWLLDNDILNKLSNPVRMGSVSFIQERILEQLLSDRVLNSLMMTAQRNGGGSLYTLEELITDVKKGIWKELETNKSIDVYRRNLQKNYVNQLFAAIKEAEFSTHGAAVLFGPIGEEMLPVTSNTDIPSYLSLHLEKLSTEIKSALPRVTDKDSKEHLQYVLQMIKEGMATRFNEPAKKV